MHTTDEATGPGSTPATPVEETSTIEAPAPEGAEATATTTAAGTDGE